MTRNSANINIHTFNLFLSGGLDQFLPDNFGERTCICKHPDKNRNVIDTSKFFMYTFLIYFRICTILKIINISQPNIVRFQYF